eukprot:3862100-Pleurochrysis_carterae.AAC.2
MSRLVEFQDKEVDRLRVMLGPLESTEVLPVEGDTESRRRLGRAGVRGGVGPRRGAVVAQRARRVS